MAPWQQIGVVAESVKIVWHGLVALLLERGCYDACIHRYSWLPPITPLAVVFRPYVFLAAFSDTGRVL